MEQFNFNNELSGKIALVTGGTKGAGRAIAERLLQAGATVIITARNAPEQENSKLHFIASDLSKAEDSKKFISEVLSTYGRLDILVNNLGGSSTLPEVLWNRVMKIVNPLCKRICSLL